MSDHEITTGGEDANTCFWNLNNTSQPMNLERSSFMPLRSTGSILSKGILTVSDDNYRWVVLFLFHIGVLWSFVPSHNKAKIVIYLVAINLNMSFGYSKEFFHMFPGHMFWLI